MLEIDIPKDKDKIKRQMDALKWQIKRDKNDIDREIHKMTIKQLEMALKK